MYHALRNERRALIQQLRGIKTVNGIRLCNMTSTEGRAFLTCFNTASGIRPCNHSLISMRRTSRSFNTASGIRLCNIEVLENGSIRVLVSIPQAVFACATKPKKEVQAAAEKFQYRKRYSPVQPTMLFVPSTLFSFQYRKRYSPVQQVYFGDKADNGLFQYRKRYSPVQQHTR